MGQSQLSRSALGILATYLSACGPGGCGPGATQDAAGELSAETEVGYLRIDNICFR